MSDELLRKLEERLGPLHARQRLGIEKDHEAQVFGQGLTFFHLENWYSAPFIIRTILKLAGLYWRARRNAESIVVRRDDFRFAARILGVAVLVLREIAVMHVGHAERDQPLVDGLGGELLISLLEPLADLAEARCSVLIIDAVV